MILDALKQRLCAALARPARTGTELTAARRLADALEADGTWADVDYRPGERSGWPALIHLERTLAIARARCQCPGEFDEAFVRALGLWLARDFAAPDARHHQIDVPRLVGSAALLARDALSPGAQGKVSEILARARWTRWRDGEWADWHATPLAAAAFNFLLRGCFEGIASWCQEAFERAYAGICLAAPGADGIQADLSFWQADAPSTADRYGSAFAEYCARFLVLGHGTSWQAPAACLGLFTSFLLDGQQWMIRQGYFDGGLTEAPLRTADHLDGLAVAVEELAALAATSRRAEMAAFARRLRMAAGPALSGHRHFWHAGLMVHQRPAFYASVRMDKAAGDGIFCILRHGDEYGGGASWDRRRLPGITALQAPGTVDPQTSPGGIRRGGGVTDGEYSVSVADVYRGGVAGRKAWFCFDESVVCLGSGIDCEEADGPVFTSINQCVSRGPVTAHGKGEETHVLAAGRSYDLSAAYRLEHDGIVYAFPEPMAVRCRVGPQGGDAPDVFSLWIDHGTRPRHESYAYAMLPAGEADDDRSAEQELSKIKVLVNSPARQAVWHQELRLVGIVFWEPGVIPLPSGRVAVNRPCILLGQDRRADGMRLSIANPEPEAATVHVEYANRCLCFNLPAGPRRGQSVTRVL